MFCSQKQVFSFFQRLIHNKERVRKQDFYLHLLYFLLYLQFQRTFLLLKGREFCQKERIKSRTNKFLYKFFTQNTPLLIDLLFFIGEKVQTLPSNYNKRINLFKAWKICI